MTGQKPTRLIGRGELAKRLTCSRQAIYKHTATGKKLAHAMVGDQINLDDPVVAAFCAQYDYQEPDTAIIAAAARQQGIDMAKAHRAAEIPKKRSDVKPKPAPIIELEELTDEERNASTYLNMTLYEITTRYGTQAEFSKMVVAAKNLVQMRGHEEEQARKRGEYIHRSHAERIVAMVDGLQKALLTDAVSSMANTTAVMVRTDAEKPEIERAMRSVISRTIKTAKEQLARALRDL